MLENLIKKYKAKDVHEIVYRLSYAGKFIIIKGRTLAGSLIIIANAYKQYIDDPEDDRWKVHLYKHFYDHYLSNTDSRFRVKTLAKVGGKIDQYQLLKREQMELDKYKRTSECLNNNTGAYIPAYKPATNMYGWIAWTAVMSFKRWLDSKERKAYVKRYKKMPNRVPAKSGL